MKCLVVEDDKIASRVLGKMISRYGTHDCVDDGQKAVDQFRSAHELNSPYDLILMDIMLPEVNGLQSVLKIRELEVSMEIPATQKVTIVMTTALDDPRTVMKALYESNADSYLVKPIRLDLLEAELRKLKLIN